jgi:ABC-2 type transport system permease protein
MNVHAQKYIQLFHINWQNGLAYPISVFFWRLRQFLSAFMSLTVWTVIFASQQQAFGYTKEEMITYIFLVGFLQSMILATVLNGLAESIYQGKISYELMKPINIYVNFGIQELADKLKNFLFIIFESLLLFVLFKPQIVFPSLTLFLLFLLSVILGAAVLFFIMLLFGVVGFWSADTWGPRFLFYMFIDFTAGKLYPLSILPKSVQNLLYLTPFPYFSYVQTQIFLNKYSLAQTYQTLLVLTAWVVVLAIAFRFFWKKGLKEYGAMGH